MSCSAYFSLLAQYNQWMNSNLHHAAQDMTEAELNRDQGAFFDSILGTLNHIMVADILWLKRFAAHSAGFTLLQKLPDLPDPVALNQMLYPQLASWWQARQNLDDVLINLTRQLRDEHLQEALHYVNRLGQSHCKPFGLLLLHLFNHQTHHRGQASTLFNQAGIDIGPTDLPLLIANTEPLPQEL